MNHVAESKVHCPYCGQKIEVLIDCSVEQQHYIEDCQVCCRPIELTVTIDEQGDVEVFVAQDNE